MSLIKRINEIANTKNLTLASIERDLGLGRGTMSKWDKSLPSYQKVALVAAYLDADLNYLCTGKVFTPKISPEHEEILTIFDKLNPKQQTILKAKLYELEADIKEDE